jgi:hypothetical protein
MKDITPDARRLVEEKAPPFIVAVQNAAASLDKGQNPATLHLTLDAFEDDPVLLYACLWYSASCGVSCCIVPLPSSCATQDTTIT